MVEFEGEMVDKNESEDSNDEAFDDIEMDDEEVLQMVDAVSDGDDVNVQMYISQRHADSTQIFIPILQSLN